MKINKNEELMEWRLTRMRNWNIKIDEVMNLWDNEVILFGRKNEGRREMWGEMKVEGIKEEEMKEGRRNEGEEMKEEGMKEGRRNEGEEMKGEEMKKEGMMREEINEEK